jgi:ferritin-like metal-binding protein YciE
MAKGAESPKLRKGFEKHLAQTEDQIERLEQVFEIFGQTARGKKCEAIEGIIAEGDTIMKEYRGTAALDAGLISSAQAVEHYEITRYGTLRRWAEMLGKRNAASLLDRSLKEESQTDEQLNAIAEQANQTARTPGARPGGKSSARRSSAAGGGRSNEGAGDVADATDAGEAQMSGREEDSATS